MAAAPTGQACHALARALVKALCVFIVCCSGALALRAGLDASRASRMRARPAQPHMCSALGGDVDAAAERDRYSDVLRNPCSPEMRCRAPETFTLAFQTNYGAFNATCVRARAPVWVDRVYNLARHGYYAGNLFFRVLDMPRLKVAQFGTAGDPSVSNIYNYSTTTSECAILSPQPPDMPSCMASAPRACPELPGVGLSNTFGTLSMSTSFQQATPEFPDGVTWNATAELFINTGDNSHLDRCLFVPFGQIDAAGMRAVLSFPSFGEVAELGGPGPSLGLLYERGNSYIRENAAWDGMAITTTARVCDESGVPTADAGEES